MKKIINIFIASILLLHANLTFGQKKPADSFQVNKPTAVTDFNCNNPVVNGACNQVLNSTLTPQYPTYCFGAQNPFDGSYCFVDWTRLHGTPQLNLRLPLIAPNVNHVSMWSYYRPAFAPPSGEGIVTRIPNMIIGHKYAISFYRRTFPNSTPSAYPYLDEANIKLMTCNDVKAIFFNYGINSDLIPATPANAQSVYCETQINAPTWQQVTQTFTANSNYDVIWIYPKNTSSLQWWLEFGKLELIDITNFTAGPAPAPVYPNCTVTLGPTVPNCSVKNAVFTWTGPSGQTITAPASQQIQIDAGNPQNTGTWILTMSVPTAVNTNNTCSNALDVQASVVVPYCSSCAPVITPGGPITICSFWEATSNPATLSTNITANIQWYKDGIIIPGANSQNYSAYAEGGQGNIVKKQNYTVKNTVTGCESSPVLVNFVPDPFAFPSSICRNTPISLFATDYGPGTTYQWVIPGAIITPNASSRQIQISFPASYTSNSYTTNLYITNSYGCNTPYINTQVFADYCRTVTTQIFSTVIFPNPTSSEITITTNNTKIEKVVITDFMNTTVKQVKFSLQKSITINLADLQPGIYNCQITTQKGIKNQKLMIKR